MKPYSGGAEACVELRTRRGNYAASAAPAPAPRAPRYLARFRHRRPPARARPPEQTCPNAAGGPPPDTTAHSNATNRWPPMN
eukprot:1438351-Lingulodinium_polyedra.AAC.1